MIKAFSIKFIIIKHGFDFFLLTGVIKSVVQVLARLYMHVYIDILFLFLRRLTEKKLVKSDKVGIPKQE